MQGLTEPVRFLRGLSSLIDAKGTVRLRKSTYHTIINLPSPLKMRPTHSFATLLLNVKAVLLLKKYFKKSLDSNLLTLFLFNNPFRLSVFQNVQLCHKLPT